MRDFKKIKGFCIALTLAVLFFGSTAYGQLCGSYGIRLRITDGAGRIVGGLSVDLLPPEKVEAGIINFGQDSEDKRIYYFVIDEGTVAKGVYLLRVSAEGFAPYQKEVSFPHCENQFYEVKLEKIKPKSAANEPGLFRGNFERTGVYPGSDLEKPSGLKWRFKIAAAQKNLMSESAPVIVGKTVYVGSADGFLYAIEAENGRQSWQFKAAASVLSSPTVAEETIYFGTAGETGIFADTENTDYFYALEAATGKLLWKIAAAGTFSSPLVIGKVVYFISWDGVLHALDKATGKTLWRVETDSTCHSSPAISGDTLFFGSDDNQLYAVDLKTGKVKWKFSATGAIDATPAVEAGKVYFGTSDKGIKGHLFAVDAQNGREKWRFAVNHPVNFSVSVAKSFVYFGSQDFYALDSQTGKLKWMLELSAYNPETAPSIAGETIYFGTSAFGESFLYAIDCKTGEKRGEIRVGEKSWLSNPAVADQTIYLVNRDGYLYAIY